MAIIVSYVFVFASILVAVKLILKKWIVPERGFVQLGLFVISEIAFICGKGVACSNCPLSFGICPIGTVQRIAFINRFPLQITLIFIALTGLILGSLSCGWGCPVGFIQDILHSLRIREIKFSNRLRLIRYLFVLVAIILIYLELGYNFFSLRGIGIFNKFIIIGGGILLGASVFLKRHFCRILCPLGLIYGRLNKISPVKVRLTKENCKRCGNCSNVCPVDLNPVKDVNSDLCVKCFNCKKACDSTN